MPLEPGIIDANALVYAVNSAAPQNTASRALLEAALDPTAKIYVKSQIICELFPDYQPEAHGNGLVIKCQ